VIGRPQPVSIGELRAVLAHVRALDAPRQARRTAGQLAAVAAFVAILAGSLRAATTHAYLPSTRHQTIEESRMRTLQSLGVVSSIAIASAATAQNAVQWRVEDGGNGHWYELRTSPLRWTDARSVALAAGGDLASLETDAEYQWVRGRFLITRQYVNLGGVQATSAASPSTGWSWLTGAPVLQAGSFDDNPCNCGTNQENNEQNYLHSSSFGDFFSDCNSGPLAGCGTDGCDWRQAFLIEWSADCNSDGIVDYGQVRSGQLTDADGDNVPDCCEAGTTCPNPLRAREWRVADGGNGHWYQLRIDPIQSFADFDLRCSQIGARLASITTAAEHAFVVACMQEQGWLSYVGWPAIGLSRSDSASQWTWVTGEPFIYQAWAPNEPSDAGRFAQLWGVGSKANLTWAANGNSFVSSAVIEWSADCNTDGLVDYGQIRSGQLADLNANNIPDCCEGAGTCLPCRADIDQSGAVNGVDLAAILNNWGTSGGKQPRSDVNADGIVDGADLAEVLNGWGSCP
jgi:hypothetical protein